MKYLIGTPHRNSIRIPDAMITMPEPKSGWSMMVANMISITDIIGITPCLKVFACSGLFAMYFARNMVRVSFRNSDGWIEKAPMPIQLRAPPRTRPIPGTSTSASSMKLAIRACVAYFLYVW